MNEHAKTPQPPYHAVIFASNQTEGERSYGKMANKKIKLAAQQEGVLDGESASNEKLAITVS